MSLNAVQADLQRLYDLETDLRVEQFLICDPRLASALGGSPDKTPEQLLFRSVEDSLDVSLYLAAELVDALRSPDEGNLHLRLLALEGVSHFLYLVWRAERGQALTRLELELQAEVDKFLHAGRAPGERDLRQLHDRHFEQVSYRDAPGTPDRSLYEEANRLAARYCGGLMGRYDGRLDHPALHGELRRFYRLPPGAKAAHIGQGMV